MAERDLVVRFIGDDRDLQRALLNTDRSVQRIDSRTAAFGANIGRAFAAAGIALGASAVFAATGKAIKAASDLNEEISKSEQVFGASSKEIQAWAETTARSIGVARTEALQATGTFGNLFRVVDIGPEAAGEMSQALVQLAADLSSFNNADPSDVLQAIRSGLIGEAEPLRRYGVLLSETRVQQEAMAATGKDNVKELTNQEKALARYNIILTDTAPAQGDFARTSGGLANQSRILKAQLADLSAELGGNLLPVMVKATSVANGLFDAFDRLGQGAKIEIDLEEQDLASLEAMREKIVGLTGETNVLVQALDKAIALVRDVQPIRPEDRAGPRGPGAVAASNARVEEQARQRERAQAKRELEQSRKRFETFIKGLGLKLDRAGLTKSLSDDLAVLREIERAILRQIASEGRTFALEQQLVDNRLKQAAITGRKTAEAERKTKKTKKKVTPGKTEQQKRIEEQFEALGLTSTGAPRTPGAGALIRRLASIREQVKGTALDTDKTGNELDRIAKVLAGKFGKVGKDVRSAILDMFNDIARALQERAGAGTRLGGEITRGGIRSVENLIKGLGLTQEQADEIRRRNRGLASGGPTAFGRGVGAMGTPDLRGGGRGGDFVVNLYGDVVSNDADDLMRQLQKKARRTSGGRRGRHGGANLGLR